MPIWLNQGDVPGDLLKDLRTTDNELSVYEVNDDESNLDKIISAMAANRDYLGKLDYILIEKKLITDNSYTLTKADGNTLSEVVNKDYHLLIYNFLHLNQLIVPNRFAYLLANFLQIL